MKKKVFCKMIVECNRILQFDFSKPQTQVSSVNDKFNNIYNIFA